MVPPACLALRVHQEEAQSTLAGGEPPVPVTREPHWSTQDELEELHLLNKVEELTFSAYLMILNTLLEVKN